MIRMGRMNNKKYGFALIVTVGILAVLVLIGICLAVSMRLEENTAASYSNDIKARYLAEAGINRAIAELKDNARNNFIYSYSGSALYTDNTLYSNCGSYSVDVYDEQRKVNIHLDNMTDSTIRILQNLGLTDQQIANLIDYQDSDDVPTTVGAAIGVDDDSTADIKDAPLETIEEIRAIDGITEATYNNIKAHITIFSYQDPHTINSAGNTEARCPINVNTASQEVIEAVLKNISGTIGGTTYTISDTEANKVANDIINARPFNSWMEFKACLDGSVVDNDIRSEEALLIMRNCNPNRQKPSTYTTEFCFFSGGKYTIISTGILYATPAQTKIIARKRIKAVVDIYSVLNETSKEDFDDGQTMKQQYQSNGEFAKGRSFKVTTLNSCPFEPMNSGNDWTGEGVDWATFSPNDPEFDPYDANFKYSILPDAIKLGFWDNFDEEVDTGVALNDRLADFWEIGIKPTNDTFTVDDWNAYHGVTTVPTYKLHQGSSCNYGCWPVTDLGKRSNPQPYLTFSYFGVRMETTDGASAKRIPTGGDPYGYGKADHSTYGEGPEGPQDGVIDFPPGFDPTWTNAQKNCFCSGRKVVGLACGGGEGWHKYGWENYYPYNATWYPGDEDELSPDQVGYVVFRRRSNTEQGEEDGEHWGYYCAGARSKPNPNNTGLGHPSGGTRYFVRIYNGTKCFWEKLHLSDNYHHTKDHYVVVTKNDTGNDNFYFYLRNKNEITFSSSILFDNHWGGATSNSTTNIDTIDAQREGLIGVYGDFDRGDDHGDIACNHTKLYVDNIRIIPASPDPLALETNPGSTDPLVNGSAYYTAIDFDDTMPTSDVEWGTIWGAVNITSGGNTDSEKVFFQTSIDGGSTWDPAGDTIDVGAGIQSGNSHNIIYRAIFQTLDNPISGFGSEPYYSETVALEDVFITYLPETEVLYWSEVGS